GCKKVLEAHDILTRSFALVDRSLNSRREPTAPAADAFCWQLEIELYKLFDRVLFLNEEESRVVEPLCPGRSVAVPPMVPWEREYDREPPSESALKAAPADSFDLIFVGSSALPNVDGLKFFYYRIFVPYLRKHKVRIAVIGRVCDCLE